jgi:outer membrane lipoprotein-sorting protein
MKFCILLVIFISSLFAQSYNFTETRYSDAFGQSIELKGVIRLEENALKINYESSNKEIVYKDSALVITEDAKVLDVPKLQAQNMGMFLQIILMLHSNDEDVLNEHFTMKQEENKTVLNPKGNLSQYIEKLTLVKHEEQLKEVKLFLNNADHITISIEDEIR